MYIELYEPWNHEFNQHNAVKGQEMRLRNLRFCSILNRVRSWINRLEGGQTDNVHR